MNELLEMKTLADEIVAAGEDFIRKMKAYEEAKNENED